MKSCREGPLGDHDEAYAPLIFQRVRGGAVNTDFSGMGYGGDESPPGEAFGTERSGGSTARDSRGSATSPAGVCWCKCERKNGSPDDGTLNIPAKACYQFFNQVGEEGDQMTISKWSNGIR